MVVYVELSIYYYFDHLNKLYRKDITMRFDSTEFYITCYNKHFQDLFDYYVRKNGGYGMKIISIDHNEFLYPEEVDKYYIYQC